MKISKDFLIKIICLQIICLWPLNFVLKNGFHDFIYFFLPSIFLTLGLFLYYKKNEFWILTLMPIGLVNVHLIFVPVLAAFLNLFWFYKNKVAIIAIIISLLIFTIGWKNFLPNSILVFDSQAFQRVLTNGYLYPNIYLSRLFQNKPSIYISKFENSLLALIDPNNYFFNFHPREIILDNQNLEKLPFLAIFFFILGFYILPASIFKKFLLISVLSILVNLSIVKNFDKLDLILYIPIILICFLGLRKFTKELTLLKKVVLFIFIFFTTIQYIRLAII